MQLRREFITDRFNRTLREVQSPVTLASITRTETQPGWLIRTRDPVGDLPVIWLADGNSWDMLDELSREAAKLTVVSRIRERVVAYVTEPRFLLPSITVDCHLIGVVGSAGPARFGIGNNSLVAWLDLWRRMRADIVSAQ